MKKDAHLPWNLNPKECNRFVTTWFDAHKCYETKIRRQREKAKKSGKPVAKSVLDAEEKLKSEHLICPDKFSVFGGIVPCRRKNARKMTYVTFENKYTSDGSVNSVNFQKKSWDK